MNSASIGGRDQVSTVAVDLGDRTYKIEIGSGLISRAGELVAPHLRRRRAVIVSDENVARLYLDQVVSSMSSHDIATEALVLPSLNEKLKSWSVLRQTVEWLLAREVERSDMLLALGGGCIGDMAGFAAAILRRGIEFVQIPTTLQAQVDSAIGGKTGINSDTGKNLVGSFHQPRLVVSDVSVLATLPGQEFLSGLGEVVKYGLIRDAQFFAWLEANAMALDPSHAETMVAIVRRSCLIKASLVAEDEKETGSRQLLNLGHTFGHGLECAFGYDPRLRHGEAVGIGCMLALDLSVRCGFCSPSTLDRLRRLLENLGMKTRIAQIEMEMPSYARIRKCMQQDKKRRSGVMSFVLLHKVGDSFVFSGVDPDLVRSVTLDSMA